MCLGFLQKKIQFILEINNSIKLKYSKNGSGYQKHSNGSEFRWTFGNLMRTVELPRGPRSRQPDAYDRIAKTLKGVPVICA